MAKTAVKKRKDTWWTGCFWSGWNWPRLHTECCNLLSQLSVAFVLVVVIVGIKSCPWTWWIVFVASGNFCSKCIMSSRGAGFVDPVALQALLSRESSSAGTSRLIRRSNTSLVPSRLQQLIPIQRCVRWIPSKILLNLPNLKIMQFIIAKIGVWFLQDFEFRLSTDHCFISW